MELETLRARAQAFSEAIAREGYLAYSGHQDNADFQSLYKQYADLFESDVLHECVARFQAAPEGSDEERASAAMLEWMVESIAGRRLAVLDEREIALENALTVHGPDGREIPYQSAAIEIMNSTDRAERIALDMARAKVALERVAPIRLQRLQTEKELVEELQVAPSYNATFEALTGVSLQKLADACAAFLRDTQAMWDDSIRPRLREFGVTPSEAQRSDASALFRLREFDDGFPGAAMEATMRRNCTEMGIDATANGRIVFDLDDRPGKRPRAFCSPVRVPQEVYLVMRPHGGQSDYNTFLHELGHALHFGYARPELPFEFRWLGDNSVTESYAMLFDHRMQDRGWLSRYTELRGDRVGAFLRAAGLEELHFLRRYCAKLLYEVQVYDGTLQWGQMPDLYVTTLTQATGFQYHVADAFLDLDPRYYSTRYLRAWQLQALLNATLTEKFNEDWWRNPSAGPWIVRELFGEGQRETGDELAARVSGTELSFAPLIKQVERLLDAS